ncbi:ABC transporter substrate-binding protein [Idiomarina seosinensis]|uniref:ABC transporter substrate-binding protein n=1 Tax=Idiomarina seosinensis TaxID=281739 RepID=UPI00384CEA3B
MAKWLALLSLFFCLNAWGQAQTVYFYAWGGNPAVNDYLRWATRQLRAEDIDLRHVKVADISEVVKQLTDGRSNADLLWINGENFHALKAADALAPVAGDIDNLENVRDELNWQTDFGEPVEGLEVPWGVGQFYLLTCRTCLRGNQVSAEELLIYAERNPGQLSYPKPPEFHGTTFLKALLLSLSDDIDAYQQPVSAVDAESLTRPLWRYLERLHPLLWRQGQNFPSSAAQMRNWFANGSLDIAVSFNPNEVQTLVQQGRIPSGSRRLMLGQAAITNHHYLAVPSSAAAKEAARRVIEFMLSESAQERKARLDGWGDPAVIKLPGNDSPELLLTAADFHASWQTYLEQAWLERFQ